MEAAKELHDAIHEASMARRHDAAGWILLHPGGPLPDTYTPLLIANVLPRHNDLVPAVAALRKAAKSNWTQGRRAWGAGGIKLQLVKMGDPGHKGGRHYVWVNVATRESTTTERALKKNSKTLETTEFPIPVVDALGVYEATNRVLNRPADAFTYHHALSPEQLAPRELDSRWRLENDKKKPDWTEDSTPLRAVRARRQVPAAVPQAPQKKRAKLQQAVAEPAEPSRMELAMPATTKAIEGRKRARGKPISEFKSSCRHSEAMNEWGDVILESLRTVYGAQEGNDGQLAAGLADAAKKLGVRDQVQGTLAKRGRPPNVRAAELLEGAFQMNLSHTQTKQLATFMKRKTNSSVATPTELIAEKRNMVTARCPKVQRYPEEAGMSLDSRFVSAKEFIVKAMQSPELQSVLDLGVSATSALVVMVSCDGAHAARNVQNELCVATLLNDAYYANSVHSGCVLSAGDAKENAETVAAIMSNTLRGLELGDGGALPTIQYRCTRDEKAGRNCATCCHEEAVAANKTLRVCRKRRAKLQGHRPDAAPPAEDAKMHEKEVDLRIVVDGACMTYMANCKQGTCPHCLDQITNTTNASNCGISFAQATAKLAPMERYEKANDAYREAEKSHRERLGASWKKNKFKGSKEHKLWEEKFHRHKGPSLLPKFVGSPLSHAAEPLHCASAVVSKALGVSVLAHIVAQELANQHREGYGPGWFMSLWVAALRDPQVNLTRLASGYEKAYQNAQSAKSKVSTVPTAAGAAESVRGQVRQLDRGGGKLTLRVVQVSCPH